MSNALNITPKNHATVVETENAMILMGNYYQKEDMSCISKKGCIFNNISVGNNTLNISRYMNISTSYRLGERDKRFGIIKDPYITNRYYYVINNHHSNINNAYSYMIIADEKENDLVIKAISSNQNIDWREIFDIDENYIYASGVHLANGGIYVYRINKNNGKTAVIFQVTSTNRAKCNLIYKNETYLYFITGGVTNGNAWGRFYFTRYNKNNFETLNTLYTPPNLTAGTTSYKWNNTNIWMPCNNIDIENFYQERDKYYWCYPQRPGIKLDTGDGPANNNLMVMCYDSSKSFNELGVITFRTTNGLQDIEQLKWKDGGYFAYRFWIIDNYLYYAIYDETNSDNDMKNIQGIHVFKINPGFELEYVDKIQITIKKNIISMLYNSDKKNLLIGYYNSFEIYLYDEESHLYKPANKEITNIASVGFDSMDRLWYQDLNGGVFVENLDDPQYVTVKFERLYYTYEGNDIDTYITFEAKSFTDKIPNGLYTLRLTGNAHFKDNGIKSLTISYTGGTEKLDIVVTGPKRIVCDVEFQKVW
ncbi:MAG: hypothetical protein SPJ62_13855 [Inconstantimicrobium porci]|uniref:hypothetical protein n=1 Tax=Inconstantimicrobium porci TaxID=2652291 RepID=UPI002A90A870|nr:hypothetical protein [Inconstantimicrobium porci]MDY5913054.1 hypothetical protein [Inconstantimicrobium porci]